MSARRSLASLLCAACLTLACSRAVPEGEREPEPALAPSAAARWLPAQRTRLGSSTMRG